MSGTTAGFFAALQVRGHEPLLERMDRVFRFELDKDGHTEYWMLTVRRGELRVTREKRDADCVIATLRDTFDRIVRGETKPLAAWLRNEIAVEGQLFPLIMLERLLPAPPGAHDPRQLARSLVPVGKQPRA